MEVLDLTTEEMRHLETAMEAYDQSHMPQSLDTYFTLGIKDQAGQPIAGLFATSTAFKIVYVSTLFVAESYRRQGLGSQLMAELEKRAKSLGANLIRLDTFDWQGKAFYEALGYQEVGTYQSPEDGFSEHFFLKRL